ncbi:hypothetical protein BG000_010598 [Podila horticola]|nr:hypothetical protein BG000_010598 [Podila horticola]
MPPFTLAGKQSELQDQSEQFDEPQDWRLVPQKRAWVPDQRFCDDNYNNNNEVSPEKAAHFLQDDILQRTRTVWIKQGSEFEGAIGCTRHDPLSNPFAADADALSKRMQIRTALAQNAGESVLNFTVPVAEETINAYLKALDLRWYQQCSGGKAPISQRPSFCQPVKNALEAFCRRLIIDTIKVGLDGPAQSAQLNKDTIAQEPLPQPAGTMSVRSSRDGPFSLVEQAEDDYDSGAPTSDEDEDLHDANPVSPLQVPVPLELELQLCEQEELMPEDEKEEQEIQLLREAPNEEPNSSPVLMVLSPISPFTEEDATLVFREFLREGSSSRVQTPVPLEADSVGAESSSSETQSASPATSPDPDPERVKVDGQALVLNDVESDRLNTQSRRESDPNLGFGVVPEYKGYVEEEDIALQSGIGSNRNGEFKHPTVNPTLIFLSNENAL